MHCKLTNVHSCPESELRSVFNRHGQVQTCIVNKDKRHAFVKMVTRRDAVTAKEAMESSTFRVSSLENYYHALHC